MRAPRRSPLFWPLTMPFLLALLGLLAVLVALVQLGILAYAYQQLGVDRRWVFALLAASILGSPVNLPVAYLHADLAGEPGARVVSVAGVRYIIPALGRPRRTLVAVNVGGALLPAALALALVVRNHAGLAALAGTTVVALVTHAVARPVRGLGVVVPPLVPPLSAVLAAFVLPAPAKPAVAYACATFGTLVGADLLNLRRIRRLGAPVVAIGGAGTFDGVFLAGIVAVLLAGVLR